MVLNHEVTLANDTVVMCESQHVNFRFTDLVSAGSGSHLRTLLPLFKKGTDSSMLLPTSSTSTVEVADGLGTTSMVTVGVILSRLGKRYICFDLFGVWLIMRNSILVVLVRS